MIDQPVPPDDPEYLAWQERYQEVRGLYGAAADLSARIQAIETQLAEMRAQWRQIVAEGESAKQLIEALPGIRYYAFWVCWSCKKVYRNDQYAGHGSRCPVFSQERKDG